ncbi:MAG: hypothetical protein EXR99_15065 [Gemmataceae bacterium]|nr:hypothetical protein [Gemmataceae bacterium]
MTRDFSPHQQKIIQRYYGNSDAIHLQKLGEFVSELFLAETGKRDRVWDRIVATMKKLEVPESRIAHLRKEDKPELIAELVKELERK